MKLAGDPTNPVRFKEDATADELREEIVRHYVCWLMGHSRSMSVLPKLVDALLHMGIEPLGDLSQLGDVGPLDQLRHDVFNAVGRWNDYGPFPLHLLSRRRSWL
jgi:hypothetical protein